MNSQNKFRDWLREAEIKENLIIINIPKSLKDLNKVLKYVNDNTWDSFNKKEWVSTNDVKYVFYDKTIKSYNYTNYEQDFNSEFFKNKNLKFIDFKQI